jgi:hypothetical protein
MNRDHLLGPQAISRFQEESDYLRGIAANYSRQGIRNTAAHNLERVRSYCEDHPGCTQKHICRALDLTPTQVHYAVVKLRATWKDK